MVAYRQIMNVAAAVFALLSAYGCSLAVLGEGRSASRPTENGWGLKTEASDERFRDDIDNAVLDGDFLCTPKTYYGNATRPVTEIRFRANADRTRFLVVGESGRLTVFGFPGNVWLQLEKHRSGLYPSHLRFSLSILV